MSSPARYMGPRSSHLRLATLVHSDLVPASHASGLCFACAAKVNYTRSLRRSVLDGFYALHGWDAGRGWPTWERLAELGMPDVYEPMVEGAASSSRRSASPD